MVYLGSKSPRRHELLKSILPDFDIISKDIDEAFHEISDINDVAEYLSEKKFHGIINELKDGDWLITADTVVISGDQILNKPQNKEEAIEMLQVLSGGFHKVITGVTLGQTNNFNTISDTTLVYLEALSMKEIEFYIEKFKPFDKAGSYGIQDWIGIAKVSKIEGSYTNVMGLPTQKLYPLLKSKGLI